MRPSDIVHLAWSGLRDRRLRSALTILGIIIGSAIIVTLISSTQGLEKGIRERVDKVGVTTLTVFPFSRNIKLTDLEINRLKSLPGVDTVIPFYRAFRVTVSNGGSSQDSVTVFGLDFQALPILYRDLQLQAGSYPANTDQSRVLVGYVVANPPDSTTLFTDLNRVITVSTTVSTAATFGRPVPSVKSYQVSGILSKYGASILGDLDTTVFISPIAARSLLKPDAYSGAFIIAQSIDAVPQLVEGIESMYGNQVRVFSAAAILENVQNILSQVTAFLGSIAAISLIVAGIGIMNTMYVSVLERTREIGVLKALGFRRLDIMSVFITEAFLTGAIGGLLGIAFGSALSMSLGNVLPSVGGPRGGPPLTAFAFSGAATPSPAITPQLLLMTLGFSVFVALVSGLYPAWRASRLDPVAALKRE